MARVKRIPLLALFFVSVVEFALERGDRYCAYDWGTDDLVMGRVAEAMTHSYAFEKRRIRTFINNDIRTKEERRHEDATTRTFHAIKRVSTSRPDSGANPPTSLRNVRTAWKRGRSRP